MVTYIYISGNAVPEGHCIIPDHWVTEIRVTHPGKCDIVAACKNWHEVTDKRVVGNHTGKVTSQLIVRSSFCFSEEMLKQRLAGLGWLVEIEVVQTVCVCRGKI